MNFRTIGIIITLLSLDLFVFSSPVDEKNNSTDIFNISIDEVGYESFLEDVVEDTGEEVSEIIDNENVNYLEDVVDDTGEEVSEIIDDEDICNSQECIEVSNNILNCIDTSVDPCEDFYQFTCGNWLKNNPLDETKYYIYNYDGESDKINESLRKIIEGDYYPNKSLSKKAQQLDEKIFNKLKNFYNNCLEVEKINNDGGKPIINIINKLKINENKDKYNDINELSKIIAKIHNIQKNKKLLFDMDLSLDDDKNIIIAFGEGRSVAAKKEAIKNILSKIFEDSNDRDFDKMADLIIKLDDKLFYKDKNYNNESENNEVFNEYSSEKFPIKNLKKLLEKNELNEIEDNDTNEYNEIQEETGSPILTNIKSLNKRFPNINWKLYLEERYEPLGMKEMITDDTKILLYDNSFLKSLNEILNDVDVETLSYYFEWFIIYTYLDYVPSSFKKELQEEEEYIIPRSEFCFDLVNTVMDEAIGRYYVEKYYSPTKKQYAEKVVEYIKQSMINRIPEVDWLDDDTIEYAYKKVAKMTEIIGYQDYIMNPEKLYEKYEKIGINENDFFNNMINYYSYINGENLKYINSTINELNTDIPPQTINAQYVLSKNLINIPVGILQPPYFSTNIPDYINYGGIGSVIGHEFTHAFDNNGKNFDMNGNFFNWWTQNDLEEYENLTMCFIDQYNEFYKIDYEGQKHYINGEKTLNENLADNGGLARAYESWKLSLKEDPETIKKENQKLPGLTQYTPDQLFFISYGYMWCENYDDPYYIDSLIQNDQHAPGNARVNGVVSNSKYFAKAFNCPLKSKMNPEKKCSIW